MDHYHKTNPPTRLKSEVLADKDRKKKELQKSEVLQSSDSPNALRCIGERLRTQDNRATSCPSFCVQVLVRTGPMLLEFSDGDLMFHDHADCETFFEDGPDPEQWANLKSLLSKQALPERVTAGGYVERWETVQTCFTEVGCAQYLAANGHNLRHHHGTRIYVDSFNRNSEMIEVREFLLSQRPEREAINYRKVAMEKASLASDLLSENRRLKKALKNAADWGINSEGFSAKVSNGLKRWYDEGMIGEPPSPPSYYPKKGQSPE